MGERIVPAMLVINLQYNNMVTLSLCVTPVIGLEWAYEYREWSGTLPCGPQVCVVCVLFLVWVFLLLDLMD